MRLYYLRLLLAASVSALGFLLTVYWNRTQTVSRRVVDRDAIARLRVAVNEVQRKPTERLIWESVSQNENLYAGEAIRTANDGEAQIVFVKSGTIIELEAESTVVLEENNGKIGLDFLKGNLFIKAAAENDQITLKSGDEQILVGNSELSVGKEKDGALDYEVLKGDVKVVGGDRKKEKSVRGPELIALKPSSNESVYLQPNSSETLSFEWKAIDKRYQVRLESGKRRSRLQAAASAEAIDGSSGRLQGRLPFGKVYYRLVATAQGLPTLKSATTRVHVLPKIPPVPVEPANRATITLPPSESRVTLSWANPGQLEPLVLEVARSPDLKQDVQTMSVGTRLNAVVPVIGDGSVYWRMSGRLKGTGKVISGQVREFRVVTKASDSPKTPTLSAPENRHRVPLVEFRQQGLELSWQPVATAGSYEVEVEEDIGIQGETSEKPFRFTEKTKNTSLTLRALGPGEYRWKVRAKSQGELVSPDSELRRFTIEGVGALKWSDGREHDTYLYYGKSPSLEAEWEKGPVDAHEWRIRVVSEREPASTGDWRVVTEPKAEVAVAADGRYKIEAEALDKNREPLARTPIRWVTVERAHPLPGPEFSSSVPKKLVARSNGSVRVSWHSVQGAVSYVAVIKTGDGQTLKEMPTEATTLSLDRLMPGTYRICLKSVDIGGRVGPESEERIIRVPKTSDVRAPKLKRLDVK